MKAKTRTEDLSPQCQLGECALCPGDNVPVYRQGRPPGEPPLFIYRCAHGCRHGLQAPVAGLPR